MNDCEAELKKMLRVTDPDGRYPEGMDPECVALCDAMNALPGIRTTSSCCGHGKRPFRVFFMASVLDALPRLLYWFDDCHTGFDHDWKVEVYTDCGMSDPFFMVEGPTGEQAYREATRIASLILGEAKGGD